MGWRDDQRRADELLFARHGDTATYTPPGGDPVTLSVLIEKDFEVLDDEGGVAEYTTAVRYRLADLASHQIGATLVADAKAYKLGKTITDDGFVRTVQALT